MTAPKSWRRCSECHRPTPLSKVSRPHCESRSCPWPVCLTCRPRPAVAPPVQGGTSTPAPAPAAGPDAAPVVVGLFVVADAAPGVWRVRDLAGADTVLLQPVDGPAVEYLRRLHAGGGPGLLVRSRSRVTPHVT